jgi:hypothetical protein
MNTKTRNAQPNIEGGWVWQARNALESLHDIGMEHGSLTSSRSVYLAYCQLAPKDGSGFLETKRVIVASIAGVSVRTVDTVNGVLRNAGLIEWQSVKVDGFDMGIRVSLLSVRNGCSPVRNGVSDKSGEGLEKERIRNEEMSVPAEAETVRDSSSKPSKLGTVRNPRPLPATDAEVLAFSRHAGVPDKVARAFIIYQKSNGWLMDGRPLVDWQLALLAWAKTDRRRVVKLDGMTHPKFWAMVDEEGVEHETANAWIALMKKRDWKLENKLTGRMEKVKDFRKALRAFVDSDLNRTLEEKGGRL